MKKQFDISVMDADRFDLCEEQWNRLLEKSNNNNIFLTWHWMRLWWEYFSKNKELRILNVRCNGELVGIAPFFYRSSWPKIGLKRIEFCSAGDLSPDYMDIIAKKGYEKDVAGVVARYFTHTVRDWTSIRLDFVLDNATGVNTFCSYFNENQVNMDVRVSKCPYITFDMGFEDFLSHKFKRKKRYNIKRQQKILFEKMGIVYHVCETGQDVGRWMDKLYDLHYKRASEKKIKSTFALKQQMRFHKKYCERFFEKNIVKLFFLVKDAEPIAGMYCYLFNGKMYYYQSGIDPRWRKYSVGAVLLSMVIKTCMELEIKEFDFLKGSEEYKSAWSTGQRLQKTIVIYNRTVTGIIAQFLWKTIESIKKKKQRFQSIPDNKEDQ